MTRMLPRWPLRRVRLGALTMLLVAAYVPMLFYWPCEAPTVPWPCAQTPYFLGLVRLPRGFHDLMVETRALSPFLVWAGLFSALVYGRAADSGLRHATEAESLDGPR